MMRELELLGGERVAVDGAFFHGDASKGSIVTAKRLEEQLAAVERDIEAYDAELDANDATETSAGQPEEPSGEDVAGKLATLLEKRAEAKADLLGAWPARLEGIEDRDRGRTRERVAPEGAAETSGWDGVDDLGPPGDRGERQPAAEGLAADGQVRRDCSS